jgi:nitrogen fixation/metabolism regulation signal transduction histidine kinase
LLIKRAAGVQFSESEYQLAREFGISLSGVLSAGGRGDRRRARSLLLNLPHNITWKLRAVDEITAQLISRISFMNQAFTSLTDGLLVADITGQVVFANPAACAPWGGQESYALIGQSLTELFVDSGMVKLDELREMIRKVLNGARVQRDVEIPGPDSRFFAVQFSSVAAGVNLADDSAPDINEKDASAPSSHKVIGLIVIINDVTKQRELERVKAETLQLVSHELRAPLTSIKGLSETLLKFPVPPETSPEILETIYSEAVRLNDLINRYLDVTRIESGAHNFERRPVDINLLITECARALNGLASGKGIRIKLKLGESPATVLGDAPMLTQAVNNLLINAIKYSPDGSEVEVGLADDDLRACIYVKDHGYGIPEEFQTRVFEKFYRLERDVRSEVVGTGLGLPLAKEIVERHGGQLSLESKVHEGSTFTIHLPIQTAHGNNY